MSATLSTLLASIPGLGVPVLGVPVLAAAGFLGGDGGGEQLTGEGWRGFLNFGFLLDLSLSLVLAALLAAAIGYHPVRTLRARKIEEVEAPRVNVVYATVGAIIGTLVVHYGVVVGFVIFGIGGLMRFRTNLVSAGATGRVLISTLVGLCCGLNLPHVAVLATVFAFGMIFLLERRAVCRLVVKGLSPEGLAASAEAYRAGLEALHCELVSEDKNFLKGQVAFIFFLPASVDGDGLAESIERGIDASLQGALDWELG